MAGTIDTLLEQTADQSLPAPAYCWWVVHTRVHSEKVVSAGLARQDCSFYLPLIPVHHTYAKSRATFMVPLFPGYLFLLGGPREHDVARRLRGVANILHVTDQMQLQNELRQIHRVVESGRQVDLYPALHEGRRCRIAGGPLRGVEGVVQHWRGKTRLYLAVTMLGQSATVEIEAALLEAVD